MTRGYLSLMFSLIILSPQIARYDDAERWSRVWSGEAMKSCIIKHNFTLNRFFFSKFLQKYRFNTYFLTFYRVKPDTQPLSNLEAHAPTRPPPGATYAKSWWRSVGLSGSKIRTCCKPSPPECAATNLNKTIVTSQVFDVYLQNLTASVQITLKHENFCHVARQLLCVRL